MNTQELACHQGIDKDQYDEYLAFKIKQQCRDRKSSFEYFKEESKRLDAKISRIQKKFTCLNKKTDRSGLEQAYS
jgi:hypothetical protein